MCTRFFAFRKAMSTAVTMASTATPTSDTKVQFSITGHWAANASLVYRVRHHHIEYGVDGRLPVQAAMDHTVDGGHSWDDKWMEI